MIRWSALTRNQKGAFALVAILVLGAVIATTTRPKSTTIKAAPVTGPLKEGISCSSDDSVLPPWVVGQRKQLAAREVRKAGFPVTVFPQRALPKLKPDPAVPPGVVVGQFPLHGMKTCKGGEVWLYVAGR